MCMIARDEEESIGRCLSSVQSIADEIIVVDTGSSDQTIEIAKGFGAKIIEFPWIDDFSAARNAGLEKAKGEWILFLDADEQLVPEDIPELKKLLDNRAHPAYWLTIVSLLEDKQGDTITDTFPSVRLFKNKIEHRFVGIIHEQIRPPEKNEKAAVTSVQIRHFGRLNSTKNLQKGDRNKRLLEKSAREGKDPQHQRFLKANAYRARGQDKKALDLYLTLYKELAPQDDEIRLSRIILDMIKCLRKLKRPDEVLEWVKKGLDRFPDFTDLEYLRGLAYLDKGEYEQALQSFVAVMSLGDAPITYRRQQGLGTVAAWQGLALSFLGLKRYDAGVASFRKVLEFDRKHSASALQLGSILLQAGHDWDSVHLELTRLCDTTSPAIQAVFDRLASGGEP